MTQDVLDFEWPQVPDFLGDDRGASRKLLTHPAFAFGFPYDHVLQVQLFRHTGDDGGYSRMELAQVADSRAPSYAVRMKQKHGRSACAFIQRNEEHTELVSELCDRAITAACPEFWTTNSYECDAWTVMAWLSGPATHALVCHMAQRNGLARRVVRDAFI